MNTQTHLLLAAAAFGRGERGKGQGAILLGALAPDLSIFALAAWAVGTGLSSAAVWEEAYWSEPWQTLSAISNSLPLWGTVLLVGLAVRSRPATLFAAAGLLHLGLDLPLHADDAHRHFWPLSDWRFRSPVSYWDPAHHGIAAGMVEAALGAALVAVLWRRHRARRVRAALVAVALAYALVPIGWIVSVG